jgi:hypothetical protein
MEGDYAGDIGVVGVDTCQEDHQFSGVATTLHRFLGDYHHLAIFVYDGITDPAHENLK